MSLLEKVKRRKKADDIEVHTNSMVLANLKCPGPDCQFYMLPPISQCNRGHSFCSNCMSKITNCTLCEETFSSVKNLALENISERVKYPCRNRNAGCSGSFLHQELLDHEERCGYGNHNCLIKNCQWEDSRDKLTRHVARSHPRDIIMKKFNHYKISMLGPTNGPVIKLISGFNEVFWFFHIKNETFAYWAVQYLGPDNKCSNFTYTFKLHHPNDIDKYVGFKKVDCLKNSDDVKNDLDHLRCIKLSIDVIENFIDGEGKVMCILSIDKNKAFLRK